VKALTTFQIAAYGPQAEEIARSTLFWDERKDVTDAFAKWGEQLCYISRRVHGVQMNQQGFNAGLAWCVEMQTMGDLVHHEHQDPWFPMPKKPSTDGGNYG
jgi:hypothetical protein